MLNISKGSMKTWARGLVLSGIVWVTVGCAGINTQPGHGDSHGHMPPPSAHAPGHPMPGHHPLVAVPETDCEIRVWYNYQVVAIPVINNRWIKKELSLKERAERAYNLRHNARINARFMMNSPKEMQALQARDMEKYGNPDGPTFDYLVAKSLNSGLTEQQTYENIITSSARTDNSYNAQCE